MRRINTSDGLYHNADVLAGIQGTVVDADALNSIQEEIIAVITDAGMELDASSNTQLRDAIAAITGAGVEWGAIKNKPATFPSTIPLVTGLSDALGLLAPKASPALTGTPTAPTAAAGTNTSQIANTAFVSTAVSSAVTIAINNLVNGSPGALDTLKELADALGDDANFAVTMTNSLASKLDKANPRSSGGWAHDAGALGQTSGSVLSPTVITASPGANAEEMRWYYYRDTAGNGWNGARWILRRNVDGSSQGSVEFGQPGQTFAVGFGDGSGNYVKVGGGGTLTADGQITAGQNFATKTGALVLATGAAGGTLYFRPSGVGSLTGQVTIDSGGSLTVPGYLTASQSIGASSTNLVLYAASGGQILLRPNGASNGTGQALLSSNGDFGVSRNLNVSGATTSAGGYQDCDRRFKRNIRRREVQRGIALGLAKIFSEWDRIQDGEHDAGVVAQGAQRIAPAYVREFIRKKHDGRRTVSIKRLAIDKAGMALESSMDNALSIEELLKANSALLRRIKNLEEKQV